MVGATGGSRVLPTFVIGLREGLEAALIVGIMAAFLTQQGRHDALRHMWLGVVAAVVLCAGIGVALQVAPATCRSASRRASRPSSARLAVAMVTYMVFFMRRHARDMRGDLRRGAPVRRSPTARRVPWCDGVPCGAP